MKRPILKRSIRTVEVVTWTLEYETVPEENIPFNPFNPTDDSLFPREYAMSHPEIQGLQESFGLLEPMAEGIAALFYTRLFEMDPSLRRLFKSDMNTQSVKLMDTLKLVVTGLSNPEKIVPVVRDLGKRHTSYGVKPEHYATVGEALLWAIEKSLRQSYTPEIQDTWVRAFGLLSGLMQEAAQEAASE